MKYVCRKGAGSPPRALQLHTNGTCKRSKTTLLHLWVTFFDAHLTTFVVLGSSMPRSELFKAALFCSLFLQKSNVGVDHVVGRTLSAQVQERGLSRKVGTASIPHLRTGNAASSFIQKKPGEHSVKSHAGKRLLTSPKGPTSVESAGPSPRNSRRPGINSFKMPKGRGCG